MANRYLVNRKVLERMVLTKEGKINLDAPLADFALYVGYKKAGNKNGFEKATYNSIREGENVTLRYVIEEFKKYGVGRFGIGRGIRSLPAMGEKRAEDLCNVLSKYGIIKGKVKKYRWMPKEDDV